MDQISIVAKWKNFKLGKSVPCNVIARPCEVDVMTLNVKMSCKPCRDNIYAKMFVMGSTFAMPHLSIKHNFSLSKNYHPKHLVSDCCHPGVTFHHDIVTLNAKIYCQTFVLTAIVCSLNALAPHCSYYTGKFLPLLFHRLPSSCGVGPSLMLCCILAKDPLGQVLTNCFNQGVYLYKL